ncbi:hypothetical protein [Dyella sp. C9]|uniref:hypothetical protein n=1 Tax=Dyella sp. C9 TaxID=2202154 RepID=UPI000DEF0354|nr:hypothetical protein [Dyella sp. C9]
MKVNCYATGIIVLAGLALAGCGVEGNHDTVIRDAVSNRVFLYQKPGQGDATVQVVRANGYFGGGCSSQIMIDDKFAAQLETGEQVSFNLPSGSHVLSLQNSGACHKPDENARVDASLSPGQTMLVEVDKWGASISAPKR